MLCPVPYQAYFCLVSFPPSQLLLPYFAALILKLKVHKRKFFVWSINLHRLRLSINKSQYLLLHFCSCRLRHAKSLVPSYFSQLNTSVVAFQ